MTTGVATNPQQAPPANSRGTARLLAGPSGEARRHGGHGRLYRAALPVVGILAAIGLWQLLTSLLGSATFPGPRTVVSSLVSMSKSGELEKDVVASLTRVAVGYAIGVVCGIILGLVIGVVDSLNRAAMPLVHFLRGLPPIAIIPVAIIWFGIGESSKYFIVAFTAIAAVLIATIEGVGRVPNTRIRAVQCLGASRARMLWQVLWPSAIPQIWTGMRIAIGMAWASVVAAELVAANTGVGQLIMNASQLDQTQRVFVGLLVLGTLGLLTDRIVTALVTRVGKRYLQYVHA